jgi:recombination protein RecT
MSTQNQIVPLRDKVSSIRALLEKSKPQLALAVPSHLKVDRLLRVAMTSIQKNPKLLDATPTSLIGAVMECAQLGLEPDGLLGHAYLVPFRNKKQDGSWQTEVTLIPGYKGLYKLVRNSGELSTVTAEVVYKQDQFTVSKGLDPRLEHVPAEDVQEVSEDDIRAFYAVARLKDGGVQFVLLWKWQVDAIRARSKAKDSGPWVTDYVEMGKKTALRQLAKLLPTSVEVQRAVALDERADAGISQDLDSVIDISASDSNSDPETAPASKLDQVVEQAQKPRPVPPGAAEKPSPAMEHAKQTFARKAGAGKGSTPTPASPAYTEGADPDPFLDAPPPFERDPGQEG